VGAAIANNFELVEIALCASGCQPTSAEAFWLAGAYGARQHWGFLCWQMLMSLASKRFFFPFYYITSVMPVRCYGQLKEHAHNEGTSHRCLPFIIYNSLQKWCKGIQKSYKQNCNSRRSKQFHTPINGYFYMATWQASFIWMFSSKFPPFYSRYHSRVIN
jgi:hypothetical protein